jgi:HK97 family phage prohead protease
MIRLTAQQVTLDASADGEPTRQITGLAVPWNVKATLSGGESVIFLEGSLPEDGPMPKLLEYHDETRVIGRVTERVSTSEGMMFVAKLSATRAADDALALLADGALDSVSVGAVPTKFKRLADGTLEVSEARFLELSVVTQPAYESAQVYSVAASSPEEEAPDEEEVIPNPTPTSEEDEMSETIEASAVPTAPIFATAKAPFKLPSPSEYIAAMHAGGSDFAQLNANIKAAAPNVTTTDTPGILPEIITGNTYDSLNPIRPFVSAIGTRAMPQAGATFRRAKITTRPTATQQSSELATLDPSTVVVSNTDISKLTFGTYVVVSEQDVDFTDPASIDIILNQLAIAYGQATDNYAVDQLVSQTSQTETLTSFSGADIVEAIYGAAYQISNSSNYLPTHYVVAPVTWAKLGMAVDNDNRPVFPFVGAPNLMGINAPGTQSATSWNGNPLGLSLVVDKNMAGGTTTGTLSGVVGHAAGPAAGFEFYESNRGAVQVQKPSILGVEIAWRGFAAVYMADATKFVKIVNA